MGFLPLAFGVPMVLWGLLALPVVWWLLRLTPPRPQAEIFPPLRILARVARTEETPQQSPWWLTLLRLLLAGLVILALAAPVFNPREKTAIAGEALAIVMDNGWASAPDWDRRVATASRLIADARDKGVPVVLAMTAEKPNAEIGPFDAETALEHLNAAVPRPVPPDRPAVFERVAAALADLPPASVAVLSDGLAQESDAEAFDTLFSHAPSDVRWISPDRLSAVALVDGRNGADAFSLTAIRAPGEAGPRQVTAYASDEKDRRIADTVLTFGPGETRTTGAIDVPFEMRNDFSSIGIAGESQAGAVRVLDENSKRRRVGLLAEGEAGEAQPLLSPLYYIRRALSPFADFVEPADAELTKAVPELIEKNPAVIVMADIGTLPPRMHEMLVKWVRDGGTLLRFAGTRMASAAADEELLPVRLRTGERSLGGTLSWTRPQAVAPFPDSGPFSDLPAPHDVTVSRQVLAEPSPGIVERTWASLADGTPLVTGARRGEGTVVLFHIAPQATWSNLPISGSFVEMLRRVVQLSHNQGQIPAEDEEETGARLAPYRMISAAGQIVPPPPEAEPLPANGRAPVTLANPPGLYGSEDGVVAHNLLAPDATLAPIVRPDTGAPVAVESYAFDRSVDLEGPLLAAALMLLLVDTLAVLWMGGMLKRRPRGGRTAAASLLAVGMAASLFLPAPARAQDARPGDDQVIAAVSKTRIAYVVTGNASIDAVSRAGIEGLSRFLTQKTALEPGAPAGVHIGEDELAFYPLIYWPVDADSAAPSAEAMAQVDAYMRQGGTVLFDTRDQYDAGFSTSGSASPATMKLREILGGLNVPPLEPVPDDHVLTKSFYILRSFPGRYRGSPLWVEASQTAETRSDRPVRTGDGVSPIMITANDFAGAWAVGADGAPLMPTIPGDPAQREFAYRAGVNIMMYMLTGNYKSDQVHVPTLLERLGQ